MRKYPLLIVTILSCFFCGCSVHHQSHDTSKPMESSSKKHPPKTQNYITIKVGTSPLSPTVSDFNQDGYQDIAVISHGDSQLKIIWGGPNRIFKPGPVYGKDLVGYHPGKIIAVDWNKDGLKDIILACEGIFEVQLWQNTGSGFEKKASQKIPINALSIKSADLDGDGILDLALAPHQGNKIAVLWGKENGFSFDAQTMLAGEMARNIEIGDWNHDGLPDLFWVETMSGSVRVAINKGNRKFDQIYIKKPGKAYGLVKDGPCYVKVADMNGDGCTDTVVTFEVNIPEACTIFYGDCHGRVASKEHIKAPAWGFSGLAVAAFNKGSSPLIALGEEGRIFIGERHGKKWRLEEKPAGSLPRDFSFADLDNDGKLDLIFSNAAGETIGVLFGPLATSGQN